MEKTNNIRQRTRGPKSNEVLETRDEKKQDPEFTNRESPLTVLIQSSLHIRAIYHIFVVILLILLCDTVIYDLVERGKINIAISTVAYGFGDIGRGAKLWLFELSLALIFYPGLLLYSTGARILKNKSGLGRIWNVLAITGLAALESFGVTAREYTKMPRNYIRKAPQRTLISDDQIMKANTSGQESGRPSKKKCVLLTRMTLQTALVAVPIWDLGRKHLALASGVTVTCEMFRFLMKIHAVAIACASRWRERAPLPTFQHYVYFLFAPTLIYRDQYPRTKTIRWSAVIFNFIEVAAIIFYNSFLWERFILPYWSDYGKESKVEAGTVVRGMFACVLPGVISFLCGFYCLLHAWLNAFAEMLKFGDRLFYEEWWTTSQFAKYYRAWNRVVHSWLRDHIYKPLIPHTGRVFAIFMVFFVSAAAHEVILALSFGFFYPVLMLQFGVLGLLLVPVTAASGRRYPSFMNLLMWLSFFLGNGILWSLYPMEYFARKNCPPSDTDSFFIPKSWSCPEIVLKANWTFHNPFQII